MKKLDRDNREQLTSAGIFPPLRPSNLPVWSLSFFQRKIRPHHRVAFFTYGNLPRNTRRKTSHASLALGTSTASAESTGARCRRRRFVRSFRARIPYLRILCHVKNSGSTFQLLLYGGQVLRAQLSTLFGASHRDSALPPP